MGDEAYPAVLERLLRRRLESNDVGVLNAGITSYSPVLHDVLYRRIVKAYRPQVVVLMLDCTDIGDDIIYGLELKHAGRFAAVRSLPDPYLGSFWRLAAPIRQSTAVSAPWRLIHQLISRPAPFYYYDFKLDFDETVETNRYFIYRHPLEKTRPHFDASFGHIQNIAEQCRQGGVDFVLIVAPRYHHWNITESPDNWERDSYRLDEPYQYAIFEYFEEKRGRVPFHIYSLLTDFQATKEFPLVFHGDAHWNLRGHAFVAERLCRLLLDEFLVMP